jgi:predicted PurR-regulated permease PerM
MEKSEAGTSTQGIQTKRIVHIALQLAVLGLLIVWCMRIIAPFTTVFMWAAILAVTLYPMQQKLKRMLKGRGVLAAIIITAILLILFLLTAILLGLKTSDEIKTGITEYRQGGISIPPPPEKVKNWPLIGKKVDLIWNQTSKGLDSLIQKYPAQTKAIVSKGLDLLASTGKGVLIFALSIIISGVFLSYAEESANFARALCSRFINSTKFDMAGVASITIRNVVRGILGVALIQSLFAGLGMIVGGIPYAGIWILLCLILSIVQIGMLPVSIGVIVYIWGVGTSGTAILVTIWMIVAGLLDNILKPILMGKGAPVPMLVIFLGALGGFLMSGFIGLFTGAVILSLGYRLFDVWLREIEI